MANYFFRAISLAAMCACSEGGGAQASPDDEKGGSSSSDYSGGSDSASGGESASSSGGVVNTSGGNGSGGKTVLSGGGSSSNGSSAQGGALVCGAIGKMCQGNIDCCQGNCRSGYCADPGGLIKPTTGGSTSSGGSTAIGGTVSSGGSTMSATCSPLGAMCGMNNPCCKSSSYEIVCNGVCQIALVANGGSF